MNFNLCKKCRENIPDCRHNYHRIGDCANCGESILVSILNYKKPMEKTLKMSVETARRFYKECLENGWHGIISEFILENFTKEELEEKKGFTWEDSFCRSGYCLECEGIKYAERLFANEYHKMFFKTEKQALSALAFAQLTHIVAKYNEKNFAVAINGYSTFYSVVPFDNKSLGLYQTTNHLSTHLPFNSKEDARISMEVNADLWKQYYMI